MNNFFENVLSDFEGNPGTSNEKILKVEQTLGTNLPEDYKNFLVKFNGGEGYFGKDKQCIVLWKIEELNQFNKEYEVLKYGPGLILFGGNGGGEGFGFDTRKEVWEIVIVPLIGMGLKDAILVGTNFTDFLLKSGNVGYFS